MESPDLELDLESLEVTFLCFRETGMTKVVELRDLEELTDDYLR